MISCQEHNHTHKKQSGDDHKCSLDWDRRREYLPDTMVPWPKDKQSFIGDADQQQESISFGVPPHLQGRTWVAPRETTYFFCDQHADADAFLLSLVASGGVEKFGHADHQMRLTQEGKKAVFIIGGDCLDKGPSNLRLLDVLCSLRQMGANLKMLWGNHDLRTYLGYKYLGCKDGSIDHLFLRMGKKTIPFLNEVYCRYFGSSSPNHVDSFQWIREILFPSLKWYRSFPMTAKTIMSTSNSSKELIRIREKKVEFEEACEKSGLSLHMVYCAAMKIRELFFDPNGKYHWFFQSMNLAHRDGSCLFLHAGLDDTLSHQLHQLGHSSINRRFRQKLEENPLALYHGPLGNAFRTKYRNNDLPFTEHGATSLNRAGIHAIVHGHRNTFHGHRISIRNGMINLECDNSVDHNTRRSAGVDHPGASVAIFRPDGNILGISTDYPKVKIFNPR